MDSAIASMRSAPPLNSKEARNSSQEPCTCQPLSTTIFRTPRRGGWPFGPTSLAHRREPQGRLLGRPDRCTIRVLRFQASRRQQPSLCENASFFRPNTPRPFIYLYSTSVSLHDAACNQCSTRRCGAMRLAGFGWASRSGASMQRWRRKEHEVMKCHMNVVRPHATTHLSPQPGEGARSAGGAAQSWGRPVHFRQNQTRLLHSRAVGALAPRYWAEMIT